MLPVGRGASRRCGESRYAPVCSAGGNWLSYLPKTSAVGSKTWCAGEISFSSLSALRILIWKLAVGIEARSHNPIG